MVSRVLFWAFAKTSMRKKLKQLHKDARQRAKASPGRNSWVQDPQSSPHPLQGLSYQAQEDMAASWVRKCRARSDSLGKAFPHLPCLFLSSSCPFPVPLKSMIMNRAEILSDVAVSRQDGR